MEGFKKIIKMKTGGSVSKEIAAYEKRERKTEDKADIKQDKAIVKKAIAIHDKQEHPGEKTDLSKLKKGGRAKKEKGTVKKYKDGGAIEMKKTSGDIDKIRAIKATGVKKAAAPSKASVKAPEIGAKSTKASGALDAIKKVKPASKAAAAPSAPVVEEEAMPFCKGGKTAKYKTGGKVKKMADGRLAAPATGIEQQRYAQAQQDFPLQKAEAARARARARNLAMLSPMQQQQLAAQQQAQQAQQGFQGQGAISDAERQQLMQSMQPQAQPAPPGLFNQMGNVLREGINTPKFNGGGMVQGMGLGQASGPMGIAAHGEQFQPGHQPLPRTGY